ncbi:hypothetical protein NVP1047O_34 [Vibrio phage 1.047.O._10N.286.55.F2]|nr:hypothetical protein NVP1047O_34 [Vibrio phage 1.047.O._10N.286.55.F2]
MIKINRRVGMQAYTVGIAEGMTIDIISTLRSDFKKQLLINTAAKTGYMDEGELLEKTKTQSPKERAQTLALFREQAESAMLEAYLETCVTGWDVRDTDGVVVPFSIGELKKLFLTDENRHQVNDLIQISSREELFWIKETNEAIEQVKK